MKTHILLKQNSFVNIALYSFVVHINWLFVNISTNKLTLEPANIVLSIFVPFPTPTTERHRDNVSKALLAAPRGDNVHYTQHRPHNTPMILLTLPVVALGLLFLFYYNFIHAGIWSRYCPNSGRAATHNYF